MGEDGSKGDLGEKVSEHTGRFWSPALFVFRGKFIRMLR